MPIEDAASPGLSSQLCVCPASRQKILEVGKVVRNGFRIASSDSAQGVMRLLWGVESAWGTAVPPR